MECKIISANIFDKLRGNRGIKDIAQKGCLDGTYEELLLYVNWVLESNHNENSKHFMEAIKVLNEKYNMPFMTKQFFMNQLPRDFCNKSMRVKYLLNQLGMTTTPTFRYYHYQRKGELVREQFDKLIDKSVLAQQEKDMRERFLDMTLEKITSYFFDGKVEQQEEIKENEPCMEIPCKKCGKIIRLHLTPNLETDRNEALAYGIYSAFVNDIEKGISFCADCTDHKIQGIWKTEKIADWLNENKGKCLTFTAQDFCKEFRNDKKIVAGVTVKYKLDSMDMPVEVIVNKEKIRIKI